MSRRFYRFVQKYWVVIALVLIIALGIHIRMLDYRWPYLRNIDSYNFARQIEEISIYGSIPLKNTLTLAPYGSENTNAFGQGFYIYLAGYTFIILKMILSNLTLFSFLLWLSPVLASLMAIPMYFIGKMLFDRRVGVLAAFFIVFDFSIMGRTLGGDPDNDAAVLLMPLVAIAVFLLAYRHANATRKIDKRYAAYTILSGVVLGLWGLTWGGYWYVVWLLTGFVIVKIVADMVKNRSVRKSLSSQRHTLTVFASTIIIFFLITVPVIGVHFVQQTIMGPFMFGDIKSEENTEFPNVYVSVAELQSSGDVKSIIQRTAPVDFGKNPLALVISPFFLMIYGLLYLAYSYVRKRKHLDTLILLLIWFIGPFVATVIAVRFSILFSAPIAIGSAIFLSKIIRVAIDKEKMEE